MSKPVNEIEMEDSSQKSRLAEQIWQPEGTPTFLSAVLISSGISLIISFIAGTGDSKMLRVVYFAVALVILWIFNRTDAASRRGR